MTHECPCLYHGVIIGVWILLNGKYQQVNQCTRGLDCIQTVK